MKFVLFCESRGDERMVKGLVDRVLREEGPSWIADLMDADATHVREWSNDHQQRSFFDVHALDKYLAHHKVRPLLGHFDGKPGNAGAQMARNIFSLVRALDKSPDRGFAHNAVFVVWDMDDQGKQRREGLEQARTEASKWAAFKIIYGCPDPEHETWLLASFEPETETEREILTKLRQDLGFCPIRDAHLADATADGAKKNPKRITNNLMGDDPERRARCLQRPVDKLREVGANSGLCAFLDEVRERMLPLATISSK